MARVAVLSEYADVTVMLDHLLTPGHEVLNLEHPLPVDAPLGDVPDLAIVPIFRHPEAFSRPIADFDEDVAGARSLRSLWPIMVRHNRPLIIFGIGIHHADVPVEVRYHTYLTFPQAIQELNPLISSLIGPAPQPEGGRTSP